MKFSGEKGRHNRNILYLAALALLVVAVIANVLAAGGRRASTEIGTNVGMHELARYSDIDNVQVDDVAQTVTITYKAKHYLKYKGATYPVAVFTYTSGQKEAVSKILEKGNYKNGYTVSRQISNTLSDILTSFLPLLLLFGLMYYMMKKTSGGFGGAGKVVGQSEDIGFKDVQGEDTAIAELEEIRDILREPAKYRRAGAHMPKGILLYGPPGTGKTLLARALAGETKSTFYASNGSSFVEMFAGLGAKRVRGLFEQARKTTPSIIFIDEIDAIGGSREMESSNSEREQTLNQLLVEMDGFDQNGEMLVIAATNRPDMLDKALLRPGRFDRQVEVDIPDMKGREDILTLHSKRKKLADDVDLHWVAQQTTGFSGAQLENVMNEAALMSVRRGADRIEVKDVSEGIDRVMAGPQKSLREDYKSVMRHTAIHEGGHALVAMAIPGSDPVTKITVLPRGRALGYTVISSDDDQTNYTYSQIRNSLASAMGGRAAEVMKFGEASTGAANDIEKATQIARDAVEKYSFGKRTGLGTWSTEPNSPISAQKRADIDADIDDILSDAMANAKKALEANADVLDYLADRLVDRETLNGTDIDDILSRVHPVVIDDGYSADDKGTEERHGTSHGEEAEG